MMKNISFLVFFLFLNSIAFSQGVGTGFKGRGTGAGGGTLQTEDEASVVQSAATIINFEGAGVTATESGGKTLVTIPGSGSATITVEKGDAAISAVITVLDFGIGISANENPSGEANIALDFEEFVESLSTVAPAATDTLTIIDATSGNPAKCIISALEGTLEGFLDLSDLQGAVVDAQVPDDITIQRADTAYVMQANASDDLVFLETDLDTAFYIQTDDIAVAGQTLRVRDSATRRTDWSDVVWNITPGVGLSGGGTGADVTLTFASDELNGLTWGTAGAASFTWTYDVSTGTDPAITYGDGVINVSIGTLQQGGIGVVVQGDVATLLDGTANRTFYTDGAGDIQELAHGTSGQVLKSNGPSSAPSWQADATGGGGSATADSMATNHGNKDFDEKFPDRFSTFHQDSIRAEDSTRVVIAEDIVVDSTITANNLSASRIVATDASNVLVPTITGANLNSSISDETVAFQSNDLSVFAATTSAQLRSVLSDESGTGVFLTANGDGSALTGLTETQITFNTNNGSRHDHVEADITDLAHVTNYLTNDADDVMAGDLILDDDDVGTALTIRADAAGTGATVGLLITTDDDDNANYGPLEIRDDSGINNDLLFGIDNTGAITTGTIPTTGITGVNAGTDLTADLEEEVTQGSLADNVITEAELNVVNGPADEDLFTYESTTGDFEWHTPSELGLLTSETNDLETDGAENIADTEIFVGNGVGTGTYVSISGGATMTNGGVLTVANNHIVTGMIVDGTIIPGDVDLSQTWTFTDGIISDGSTDRAQIAVQGNATQTNPLILGEQFDGTDVFHVENSGVVETATGFDAIGAVGLSYGSADVTDHTFTTDGTGDAEIVLPNQSIGATEILNDAVGATQINETDNYNWSGTHEVSILNFTDATELTIATGAITITQGQHAVDTEADAASDLLATINGGTQGDVLIISPAVDTRSIIIDHDAGNISCVGQADITLDDLEDFSILTFNGTTWFASNLADAGGGSSLTVEEEDGTPSVSSVTTINVTNGTLTDNGGGDVSIDTGGGSGGVAGGDSIHTKTFYYSDFITTTYNDSVQILEQGLFRDRVWRFAPSRADTILCQVQWKLPDNFGAFLGISVDALNISDTSDDTFYVHMEGIANDEAYPTDLSLANEAALIRFVSGPVAGDLIQFEDTSVTGTYAADDVLLIMVRRPANDAGILGFKNLNIRWRED